MQQPEIKIKLNNAATNDSCVLCGGRCDPELGPEPFLAGTWMLVCDECASQRGFSRPYRLVEAL